MNNKNEARLFLMMGDPEDGDWRLVFANDDAKTHYSYRFEGGSKGRGHLSSLVDPGTDVTYTLKLKHVTQPHCPDHYKYELDSVTVSGDAFQQVGKPAKKNGHFEMVAKLDYPMQAYYVVVVKRDDGTSIECDPMISNEPKG